MRLRSTRHRMYLLALFVQTFASVLVVSKQSKKENLHFFFATFSALNADPTIYYNFRKIPVPHPLQLQLPVHEHERIGGHNVQDYFPLPALS